MPPIHWYIVVPLKESEPEELQGAASVFVVQATDMDLAAQAAYNAGFPKCAVILAVYYEQSL